MADIINLDNFRKTGEIVDPLTKIKGLSAELVMESIKRLHSERYDIQDADFLLDMEAILLLFTAALCRQCNIEHKYIKELDDLNDLKNK